jgi:hypothetical protein
MPFVRTLCTTTAMAVFAMGAAGQTVRDQVKGNLMHFNSV